MSNAKFFFWDTETTGLDKAFHQPVEIGGVVADSELSGTRQFELICRPSPFILPEPSALAVTGRSIADLMGRPYSTYEMVGRFAAEIRSVPGVCFVTYNGINFDDPMMEHTFYRHLRDPYAMKKGNTRIDMLHLMHVVHTIAPEVMAVPTDSNGRHIFKLELLAPLNGFNEGNAHTACVDARATLHLAKAIATHAPAIWDRAVGLWSRKEAVRELLVANEVVVLFEWNARSRQPSFKLLVPVAARPGFGGEFMCLDAAIDPSRYSSMPPEKLTGEITCGTVHRPLCPIRLNKMPIVFEIDDPLVRPFIPGNVAELVGAVRPLLSDSGFRDRMMAAADLRQSQFPASPHVEQQLYSGGFIADGDAAKLARFHLAQPAQKMGMIATINDPRLRMLAVRLVYEEWPDTLAADALERINGDVAARHHAADSSPWTTIGSALREIDKLLPTADEKTKAILLEYRQYLVDLSGLADAAQ